MTAELSTAEMSSTSRAAREDERTSRHTARDYLARGKEKAIELEEGFEGYVREHPIRTVLIAAGVGALVGLLVSKR